MNSNRNDKPQPEDFPAIDPQDLERLADRVRAYDETPALPVGTVTTCQICGGQMVTTNDLEKTVPTPLGLVVLTRLPGARCADCDAVSFDPAALGIILRHSGTKIVADYETTVTKASGKTLGTYFKADLARVMRLTGKEHLRWTVIDRDHALVEIDRPSRTATRRRPKQRP